MTKGILRNANQVTSERPSDPSEGTSGSTTTSTPPPQQLNGNSEHMSDNEQHNHELDRKRVWENTQANAKIGAEGQKIIRRHSGDTDGHHNQHQADQSEGDTAAATTAHLKWDEANLYLTEMQKDSTMKIDEPKTPYQGPSGSNEYYANDVDDDVDNGVDDEAGFDIDDEDSLDDLEFSLGQPEVSAQARGNTAGDSRIIVDENQLQADLARDREIQQAAREEAKLAESKHGEFERKRKQHYHHEVDMKLARQLAAEAEAEADEEEGNE